jgi:hypothetical protein
MTDTRDDSCSEKKGCDPAFHESYEELCIDGRIRSGEYRVNDEGPCPCYCHELEPDYD